MAWFRKDNDNLFEVVTEVDGAVEDRHPCDSLEEARTYYTSMQRQVLKQWAGGDFITFDLCLRNKESDEVLECDDETMHGDSEPETVN